MTNFNSTKSDYKKVLEKAAHNLNNNHLEEEKKQPLI